MIQNKALKPLTNKEIKEVIEEVKSMDDPVGRAVKEYQSKFLNITVDDIDTSLNDLLKIKSSDLVDKTEKQLQQYLFDINKWQIVIRKEINEKEFILTNSKNKYNTILRHKKLNVPGKSEKEKEDRLLATDEVLRNLDAVKQVAQSFYDVIKGFDKDINSIHFTIQRILISKEITRQNHNRY